MQNRGAHGVSSLMLRALVLSNEKPPLLCFSISGGSMSLNQQIYPCDLFHKFAKFPLNTLRSNNNVCILKQVYVYIVHTTKTFFKEE